MSIIDFPGVTKNDVPVDNVLRGATEAGLKHIVVLGEGEDGETFYFASSQAKKAEVLYMLEQARCILMED